MLRLGRATLATQAAGLTSPMAKKGALCELADAVMMLHELGVVWGDLKPDNFIQCDISGIPSRLALDFGDSALLPHVEASEAADAAIPREFGAGDACTPPYAAPERLRAACDGESIRASEAQDVWSLGMTMLFVLTGKVPFSELDDDATIEAMCDPALHVDVSHIQDEAARHALEAMLQRDPDRRPTMAQVLDRAYFRGGVSWRPSQLMREMATLRASVGAQNAEIASRCASANEVYKMMEDRFAELKQFIGTVAKKLPTPAEIEVRRSGSARRGRSCSASLRARAGGDARDRARSGASG